MRNSVAVIVMVLVLSSAARSEVVTERWGNGKFVQHPNTLSSEGGLTVDLADLPKGAAVHRARLVLAGTGGDNGYELLAADAPLDLVGPYYRWFDATAAVRKWAADKAGRGTITVKQGRLDLKGAYLEISYEGQLKDPPRQVVGVKGFFRAGQVFMHFKEIEDLTDGKDDVTWGEISKKLAGNERGMGGFSPLGVVPRDDPHQVRYRIYRHDRPITAASFGAARLLAEITPLTRFNTRLVGVNVHGEHGGVSLAGEQPALRVAIEPLKPLASGFGQYVHTVAAATTGCYAVVSLIDGVENSRDFTAENTFGPIEEKLETIEPVLTYERTGPVKLGAREGAYREQWYSIFAAPPLAPMPIRHDLVVSYCEGIMPRPAPVRFNRYAEWFQAQMAPGWDGKSRPPVFEHIAVAMSSEQPLCFFIGLNDALHTLKGLRQGRFTPQFQLRQDAVLAWLKARLSVDEQRVGVLMGVWGMTEVERPETYAWLSGWCQPNFTMGFQCLNHARGAWGEPEVYAGRSWQDDPYKRTDYAPWLLANVQRELPYLAHHSSSGAHNSEMGWPPFPRFFRAMMDSKRAFSASWGKHSWVWPATPVIVAVEGGKLDIQRDQSLPAFANCSLDDHPGSGDLNEGELAGQINGYLLWETSTIADTPDKWEMTLWVDGSAPLPECTVDLTPRRCQKFKAKPVEKFQWANALPAARPRRRPARMTRPAYRLPPRPP